MGQTAAITRTPAQQLAAQWGKRLRTARKDRGFTQTTFAEACSYNQTTISRFERGEGTWTPEFMLRFAAVLDHDLETLFPWPFGLVSAERYRIGVAA